MNRRAPVVLAAFVFVFIALLASDATRSTAFSVSTRAFNPDPSMGQRKQPAQSQTSREKSRNLVHKGTETTQPVLGSPDGGPQSFAVIIGISAYKNLRVESQLQFADQDATAIRDFLVGPNGGFKPENVDLLINEQAGRTPIVRALGKLQNAGPKDLAFIFFAGHGIVKGSQGFVLAYDSQPDDLLVTAVDMDLFNSIIKNLRARSVVILTDACHSGTIGDLASQAGAKESITSLTAKAFAETSARNDQTSFIFSAASPTQNSWELAPLKHGLFTYHVIEGLGGKADRNGNGVVTADELYDYVVTSVRDDAQRQGRIQVPEFNSAYDRSIPLAYLNDAGRKLYSDWFDSEPFIARYSALFDEALKDNHLIKPERESAWDYYIELKANIRTPRERINTMKDTLLTKLTSSSQTVIDQSPSDPKVWEEAAASLGRAYELSLEKHLRARQAFCTAMSARHSNENGRAERECDIALTTIKESNLKEPPLCFKIAQLYKSLQKLDKARDSYKLAIDAEPRVDWICEYAEVLRQLKDLAEADSQLRFARTKNPHDHRVLKLLAEVLVLEDRAEQFSEAVDIAREARQIKPNDVDIEEVFGLALLKAGRPGEALDPLRKVAELRLADDRLRDPAFLRLGEAYANSGDLDRSVSALREAEGRDSKLPELYDELSRVLEQQGDLDGAIIAAEKAATFVQSTGQPKAKRVRRVAEYLERAGRINQASLKFKEAALLMSADVKVLNSLENHATLLSYRLQRFQEAGPTRKRTPSAPNPGRGTGLLIIPGGRQPLEHLTGVTVQPSEESRALSVIFDVCLRDTTFQSQLVRFYEKYPDLERRFRSKGIGFTAGRLSLPPAGQPLSPAAVEVMAFFGVKDKNGRREVDKKEFDSKRFILVALDGDPQRLERGEATAIKLNYNDEWSVPLGMDRWVTLIKDMKKESPQTYFLSLLKDAHLMRLFAGISALPENTIDEFADKVINSEKWKDISPGVYFAAPFLRFSPEGHLYVPGQLGGEINWQRLLKAGSFENALKSLLKKDNAEALYLFAALSNAGEVGDLIARSPLLDDLYRLLKDSSLPDAREPFDLIDLLSFVRLEDGKLRLPRAVELWLAADRFAVDRKHEGRKDNDRREEDRRNADPVAVIIHRIEKTKVGRTIPVVRLIAALDQIERERPDWIADAESVALLAKQITSGRESQLELALDLQMSWQQVQAYLSRVNRIEAISTPELKRATACTLQSALELLRIVERNGIVDRSKIIDATTALLELDPGSKHFAFDVIALLRSSLMGAASPLAGQEFEKQFIALMGHVPSYLFLNLKVTAPSGDDSSSARFSRFNASRPEEERIARNLDAIRHTRLRAVIDAANGLEILEKSSSDAAAIQQVKASLAEFVEADPEPPPKKGKSKQPFVRPPTMKEVAEQFTAPATPSTLEDLRQKITPFIGQALLGAVYAVMSNPDQKQESIHASLVLNHDMSGDAWGATEFDAARKCLRGGLARLSYALTNLESRLNTPSAASGNSKPSAAARATSTPHDGEIEARLKTSEPSLAALLTATVLNSFQLVNHRLETTRAAEFVSRSIDLGEDVLGLYLLGDQNARAVVDQLDQQLTPRRAHALRANLDGSEIKKALISLSLSELYSIGQRYFALRLSADPLSNLMLEPGALGAMASTVGGLQSGSEKTVPESLRREIRQFGMTMATRTGLMRLDLRTLEPYEQSLTVGEPGRLIERLQDFKLAVARACYRRGHTPLLAFSPELVRAAVQQALGEMLKGTGRTPPDRDWQNVLRAIQAFDEPSLNALIEKLAGSGYASPVAGAKWSDEPARVQ